VRNRLGSIVGQPCWEFNANPDSYVVSVRTKHYVMRSSGKTCVSHLRNHRCPWWSAIDRPLYLQVAANVTYMLSALPDDG
jgi:hypothetical protein